MSGNQTNTSNGNMKKQYMKKTKQTKKHNQEQRTPLDKAANAESPARTAATTSTPKKPARGWSLINGEEINRLHPETFKIPPDLIRRSIEVGVRVKIGLSSGPSGGERFWVDVVSKQATPDNCSFIGKLFNRLVYSVGHGIRKGDLIEFRQQHILDIVPE
jgi:hypothetical protein